MKNEKKFIPHITLYRNNQNYPIKISAIPIENYKVLVEKLVLYESVITNNKRKYHKLYTYHSSCWHPTATWVLR